QIENFVPMASKEERQKGKGSASASRRSICGSSRSKTPNYLLRDPHKGQESYWKIIRLGGHTAVYQFFVDMLKRFDREDLIQLWTLGKETLSIRQATSDKEKELWVELKRLFEPDVEDQLWTHTQALMHDLVEWKLYDTCGVHHVLTRD
nr:hypothetical protein [Tanacetum cinerariifolium]